MAFVRYIGTDSDADLLTDAVDHDPESDHPVLTIDSRGNGFAVGTPYEVRTPWLVGESVMFVIETLQIPPRLFGLACDLYVGQRTLLGRLVVGANGIASIWAVLPNDPNLVGQRLAMQAMANQPSLPGGRRLSTYAILTPRGRASREDRFIRTLAAEAPTPTRMPSAPSTTRRNCVQLRRDSLSHACDFRRPATLGVTR